MQKTVCEGYGPGSPIPLINLPPLINNFLGFRISKVLIRESILRLLFVLVFVFWPLILASLIELAFLLWPPEEGLLKNASLSRHP